MIEAVCVVVVHRRFNVLSVAQDRLTPEPEATVVVANTMRHDRRLRLGVKRRGYGPTDNASEIFFASVAIGLSGNSAINWSNRCRASALRPIRYRQRP